MSNTFRYSLLRSHPFTRHPLQAPPFVLFLCFSQDSCPATRFSLQDPALHPATPFEKGVDPKTFSATDNILFLEKERTWNAGTMDFREPIYGYRAPSGLAFTLRKKFLRVPRGVFSKTLLGRVWDSVPQREGKPVSEVRLFRRDKVLSRNTDRPSGFAFTNLKKFLRVPRGVF